MADGAHVEIIARADANRNGVQISIWLGQSPDIAAELTRDLRTPVENKLTGQLQRAREAGLRVGLLIDAVTPPDVGNWRYFHATHFTAEEALRRLSVWQRGLDAAWFRDAQDKISDIGAADGT